MADNNQDNRTNGKQDSQQVTNQTAAEGRRPDGDVVYHPVERPASQSSVSRDSDPGIRPRPWVMDDTPKKEKTKSDKDKIGTSLLPIKGISNSLKSRMAYIGLHDIPSLLVYGRTVANRKKLADMLQVNPAYVYSWLKQADLWRVPGMTPDIAYLLVQAGVRCVQDMGSLDVSRTLPLLNSLGNAQPDFTPPSADALSDLIIRAMGIISTASGGTSFYQLELDPGDPYPYYLMDNTRGVNWDMPEDNFTALRKGLMTLSSLELDRFKPLPAKICGQVVCKKGDVLAGAPDQLVKISGFLSANRDGSDSTLVPAAYTDDQGRFELTMPDAYCFKEVVTFTVFTRDNSYSFNKNASEIIDLLPSEGKDDRTVELESPFIVDGTQIETKAPAKALPSVALLGDDERTVRLSSDTAPSRIYSYKILNRLIEPKLAQGGNSGSSRRSSVIQAIDVDGFRDTLQESPMNIYKMSSLGIGYVLNMHQAWVPDGFALGSLLYSLVLAPGEEQRILIRERDQAYDVGDEASSSDITSETYQVTQTDDEDAAYNYALNQLSEAGSSYSTKSTTASAGLGGALGGLIDGITFGLSIGAGFGYTKSSGSAAAHQRNAHNEASSSAQSFQHAIKSASERIAQSKRVSIRTASGDEAEGVSSKIIANHNHSHVMTVQYWEVMRRYKLETAIDGVDMVLFVPMELVEFLPKSTQNNLKKNYMLTDEEMSKFTRDQLNDRYRVLLKYYDVLHQSLPRKYRYGLERIRYYSELPKWKSESVFQNGRETFAVCLEGNFVDYDQITLKVYLKDGKGVVEGVPLESLKYVRPSSLAVSGCLTRNDLKDTLRKLKNGASQILRFQITLPDNCTLYDLDFLTIENHPEPMTGTLCTDRSKLQEWERDAIDNFENKMKNLYQDYKSVRKDWEKVRHYSRGLPESYLDPDWSLSERDLLALGESRFNIVFKKYKTAEIRDMKTVASQLVDEFKIGVDVTHALGNTAVVMAEPEYYIPEDIHLSTSSGTFSNQISMEFESFGACLRYRDLLRMEETFHHILRNVVRYSQVVWSSLTADELAIMLEIYTIDVSQGGNELETVPLLNCINVMSPLGFYGNCFLFPFTMPEGLSERLSMTVQQDGRMVAQWGDDGRQVTYKTEKDWQDALYNYHTNSFRVPTTVISLPTDGMVGEAVLGETNVSELIDLTRFWNWKDSDIDHAAALSSDYLKSKELLADATTAGFVDTAAGASAPTAVTVDDLISALVKKQTPKFKNLTGQATLATLLDKVTGTTSTGRDKIVESTTDLAQAAIEAITQNNTDRIKKEQADEKAAEEAWRNNNGNNNNNTTNQDNKNPNNKNPNNNNQEHNNNKNPNNNTTPENNNNNNNNPPRNGQGQNTDSNTTDSTTPANTNTTGDGSTPPQKEEIYEYHIKDVYPLSVSQTNGSWAAMLSMIKSWKTKTVIKAETMLSESGDKKILKEFNKGEVPTYQEIAQLLPKIGFQAENKVFSEKDICEMLKKHGPMMMNLSWANMNKKLQVNTCVICGIYKKENAYVVEYLTDTSVAHDEVEFSKVVSGYNDFMKDENNAGIGLIRLAD